jgi:tetratricopeptide (TPR) repeat protein
MGLIYYNQGQFSKAFDVFKKSIELDPSFVFSYQQLAKISLKNGDTDGALKFALKAIEIDSTFSQPHYLLGQIYLRLHRNEDANREIQQFQKLQASSPTREYRVFFLSPLFNDVLNRSK